MFVSDLYPICWCLSFSFIKVNFSNHFFLLFQVAWQSGLVGSSRSFGRWQEIETSTSSSFHSGSMVSKNRKQSFYLTTVVVTPRVKSVGFLLISYGRVIVVKESFWFVLWCFCINKCIYKIVVTLPLCASTYLPNFGNVFLLETVFNA
jgi:hypothetical protein